MTVGWDYNRPCDPHRECTDRAEARGTSTLATAQQLTNHTPDNPTSATSSGTKGLLHSHALIPTFTSINFTLHNVFTLADVDMFFLVLVLFAKIKYDLWLTLLQSLIVPRLPTGLRVSDNC